MLTERKPIASELSAMRLVDFQQIQDDSGSARRGMQTYMKSEAVTCLTDSAIGGIADHMIRLPNSSSLFELGLLGGALAEREDMSSAAGMRNAQHLAGFIMMADTKDGLEESIAWARSGWATLREGTASGGGYLNFDSADGDDQRVVRVNELGIALGEMAEAARSQAPMGSGQLLQAEPQRQSSRVAIEAARRFAELADLLKSLGGGGARSLAQVCEAVGAHARPTPRIDGAVGPVAGL